jgi:hypothetical protein
MVNNVIATDGGREADRDEYRVYHFQIAKAPVRSWSAFLDCTALTRQLNPKLADWRGTRYEIGPMIRRINRI